ncbi:MAG: hypothetical protein J6127_05815 [Clostridiales bacterium]|nr:hypothetical protein [Clostridiales bacterium]
MADGKYRIAVASTDGYTIDKHFGKADKFYIFEVINDEDVNEIEVREAEPVCLGYGHEKQRMEDALRHLSDCRYIIASRVGDAAAVTAQTIGIETFSIPGDIGEAIDKLIRHKKVQELFE